MLLEGTIPNLLYNVIYYSNTKAVKLTTTTKKTAQ